MSEQTYLKRHLARVTNVANRFPALSAYLLFLFLALISRTAYLRGPIHEDTGGYLYVADVILDGGVPYKDAAEPKGPMTHLLFVPIRLFAGQSATLVRLTMVLFVALAALALAGYVARYAERALAVVAGGTLAVLGSMIEYDGQYPNTEQYGIAPLVGAIYFASAGTVWSSAAAGGLTTCAVLMNPGFAVIGALAGVELLLARGTDSRLRRIAAAVGGGLAVAVPVLLWLALSGALDDMWEQVWGFARAASAGDLPNVGVPNRADPRWLFDIPGSALWAGGLVAAAFAAGDRRLRYLAIGAIVWIVLMWARIKVLSSYAWPHHYFVVLPGIALALAVGIGRIWNGMHRCSVAVAAVVLAFPIWTFVVEPEWQAYGKPNWQRWDPRAITAYDVANFINLNTPPGSPVFVAGSEGEVYWLTDRLPPTRWGVDYFLYAKPEYAKERERDLRQHPPAAIALIEHETLVDISDDVQRFVDTAGYQLAYDVGMGKVWLRNQTENRVERGASHLH